MQRGGPSDLLSLCLPVVVHKLMYDVCLADAQLLADLLDRIGIFPSEPECPVYQVEASVLATGSDPRASPFLNLVHIYTLLFWSMNLVEETLMYFLSLLYALSSILICVSDR